MIVIGVDAHKRTHTLVALDAATGTDRGQTTIQASDDGALSALRYAASVDRDRVWAVEDCRHVSARLERALLGAGERVIRVPPSLTGESRKATRTPGKSDPIDAPGRSRLLGFVRASRTCRSRFWMSRLMRSGCCAITAIS